MRGYLALGGGLLVILAGLGVLVVGLVAIAEWVA